jgi:hypothetical protein
MAIDDRDELLRVDISSLYHHEYIAPETAMFRAFFMGLFLGWIFLILVYD